MSQETSASQARPAKSLAVNLMEGHRNFALQHLPSVFFQEWRSGCLERHRRQPQRKDKSPGASLTTARRPATLQHRPAPPRPAPPRPRPPVGGGVGGELGRAGCWRSALRTCSQLVTPKSRRPGTPATLLLPAGSRKQTVRTPPRHPSCTQNQS